MKTWGIVAVLLVGLAGCGGDGGERVAATPEAPPSAPQPGAAALDAAKAETLQAVLGKIVSRYAANPADESASRGVSATSRRRRSPSPYSLQTATSRSTPR